MFLLIYIMVNIKTVL